MEKATELETKYQKVAAEYSKVRSQAAVLKKAVLDEQSKNFELKEIIKEQEQKLRKHDQEMESLTFRNEQLTKRISVLQQELQVNSHNKKSKNKALEKPMHSDFSVLDEELHKKILENAQLVSTMADKDMEMTNYKAKVEWLEEHSLKLKQEIDNLNASYGKEIKKLKQEQKTVTENHNSEPTKTFSNSDNNDIVNKEQCNFWQQEAERWRTECELLRSKPESNEQLTNYYESKIRDLLETKQLAQSETNSLWAENTALNLKLEQLILEKNEFEKKLDKCLEDLKVTSENYKCQLDAMTEHLAMQNEKITKQCDEIQVLKHKLALKK